MADATSPSDEDESTERIGQTLVLHSSAGTAYVRLIANVTLCSDEEVTRALSRIDANQVLFDFGRSTRCPTIIVGALVQLAQRLPRVTLQNVGPLLRESLDVMHLSSYFTFDDRAETPPDEVVPSESKTS